MDWVFGYLFHVLNPDRFDLTGTWEQTFKEPVPGDLLTQRPETERLKLRHLGSTVTGEGVIESDKRRFRYELRVSHSLVFGSYQKLGERGNITGRGMTQVIVSPDRLTMKGQSTWFDRDTEKIESSEVTWTKVA